MKGIFTEQFLGALILLGVMSVISIVRLIVIRPKGAKEQLTGHATVVSRRVAQKDANHVRNNMGSGSIHSAGMSRWMHLVTFDLGSQLLELQVEKQDFPLLKEGLTGQLVWQYEYLVSFTQDDT